MRKALIIIDMQNDFVYGILGTKEAQSIVDKIDKYATQFNGDIYYTRDTHYDNYLTTREGKKLPVPHCIKGSRGWQIVDDLQYLSKNIFDKTTFGSVDLATTLSRFDYDEIEFCGVCTGICVISNAVLVESMNSKTEITILENLCACVTPESHRNAIETMRTLQMNIKEVKV